jgi:hypothetical protein
MAKRKKVRKKKSLGEVSAKEQPLRTGRAIASFMFPPVGFITWATKNGEYDRKAKAALNLAVAGVVVGTIGNIFYTMQKNKENK